MTTATELLAAGVNSASILIGAATSSDFKARLLSAAVGKGLTTKAWQSGGVVRTTIATLAQVLGIGFGAVTTQQLVDIGATSDGILGTYAAGGLLRLASLVTPDPSVALSDGSYPPVGTGFLDAIADGIYNVQRSGGPNGGPLVQSNESVVAACLAKLRTIGVEIAEAGRNPYEYYATTGYGGDTLVAPINRVRVNVSDGEVDVILANASGAPIASDVTKVHDWIQATCVPWSIAAIVQPAVNESVTFSATVYVPARYASSAAGDVTTALNAYLQALPIGGLAVLPGPAAGVPLSALVASIIGTVPYIGDVDNAKLNGFASDLVFPDNRVAVPTAPTLTVVAT